MNANLLNHRFVNKWSSGIQISLSACGIKKKSLHTRKIKHKQDQIAGKGPRIKIITWSLHLCVNVPSRLI